MHIYEKIKRGQTYYYLRQTKRVNGKVICEFQKYIGNKERLYKVILNGLRPIEKILEPDETETYHYGGVAALLAICRKSNILEIIDEAIPKRNQDMTISTYLICAAINRAIKVRSKNSIAHWVEKTSLPFLMKNIKVEQLTSQNFWNNMDMITDEQIYKAEDRLVRNIVDKYQLNLSSLIYDTTNYYGFVHTFNKRNDLEKRGKNKQKRGDLRQANFALMVTKDSHIPLYHRVYNGNINDYTAFKDTVLHLKNKIDSLCGENKKDITIIFDCGNVSDDSMNLINEQGIKFISKLKPSDHKDLLKIELKEYKFIEGEKCEGIRVYQTEKEVYGGKKKIVVKYNQGHYEAELLTVMNHIREVSRGLKELDSRLNGYITQKILPSNVTEQSVQNNIAKILKGRTYLKEIIDYKIKRKGKYPIIKWDINENNLTKYCDTYLGKTIYFTNRLNLSDLLYSYPYVSSPLIQYLVQRSCYRRLRPNKSLLYLRTVLISYQNS